MRELFVRTLGIAQNSFQIRVIIKNFMRIWIFIKMESIDIMIEYSIFYYG